MRLLLSDRNPGLTLRGNLGQVMGAGLMSRKDQFNSSEFLDWLSIGIVASAAIVGYMVLMLITPGSKIGGKSQRVVPFALHASLPAYGDHRTSRTSR